MARTGRFGRLPRQAPNLASLIVQIAREMAAQEDANILQAWEEGGLFKGKKVTDQMLLKHYKGRRDAVSKDDPLWDKWNTALQNYTFAIEESKMTLKYAQHKVGEGEMANFYRKWAGKLPVNSEAYRELMRSAAEFADAAQARSSAARAGASQSAYNAAINASMDRHEKDFDNAEGAMLEAARWAGILQSTDTTTEEDDLMDLRGADEGDYGRFIDLFDQVQNDPFFAPIKDWLDKRGLDGLTYGQFVALTKDKQNGINARIKIARQFGDESGAKDFAEEGQQFALQAARVGDWDVIDAYLDMRTRDRALLESGILDPFEAQAMLDRRERDLLALRDRTQMGEDKGFFTNEIEALQGKGTVAPTMYEMNEGGIRTQGASDSEYWGLAARGTDELIARISSGQTVLTRSVAPDREGEVYGELRADDPILQDAHNGSMMFLGSGNTRVLPQFVMYRPIYAQVNEVDPRTGLPGQQADLQGDEQVGITYRVNGKDFYGIYIGEQGREIRWFGDNPFVVGSTMTTADDGSLLVSITSDMARRGGPTSTGQQQYSALSVVQGRALNENLQWTKRYDNPLETVYDNDAESRQALLKTSDQQIRALALTSPNPDQTFAQLRDLRNNIVEYHNARAIENMDRGIVWRAGRGLLNQPLSPALREEVTTYRPTLEPGVGESEEDFALSHARAQIVGRNALEGDFAAFDANAANRAAQAWEARVAAMSVQERMAEYGTVRPTMPTGITSAQTAAAQAYGGPMGPPNPQIKVPGFDPMNLTPAERIQRYGTVNPPNLATRPTVYGLPETPEREFAGTRIGPREGRGFLPRFDPDDLRIRTPSLPRSNFDFASRRSRPTMSGFQRTF